MKKKLTITLLCLLIFSTMGSSFAFADGSTGTGALTDVVAQVVSEDVVVDITEYASAYSAGKGNELYDYLSGGSGIVLKGVVSGTKYMDITAYASSYSSHGSNAIANTPPLPEPTIQDYQKFDGFDEFGDPILTPIFEDVLKFELDSYEILEGEVDTYISNITLTEKVSGGSGDYSFSQEGYWPDWLKISNHATVYISGKRPAEGQDATNITVKVTDNETGKTATADISVGAVYYGPIKFVSHNSGSPTYTLDKEKPYYNGWSATATELNNYYAYYDVYTRTLTLNNLETSADLIVEQGPLNIILNDGTTNYIQGAIQVRGDINISGNGKLEMAPFNTPRRGSIHSIWGGVNINGGEIKLQVIDTDNFGIKAGYGPVNIGGNTKLDIYVGSSGTNNYGIWSSSYGVNIKDRANVEIEVKNATNNYGIYASSNLDITTKSKLVIETDTSKQGKAVQATNIKRNNDDYTITGDWNSRGTLSCIYNGNPEDVSAIKVKTFPEKPAYFVGQKLDLRDLVVTLEKEEGGNLNIDVPLSQFEANGITVTPSNGSQLKATDTVVNFKHEASGAIGQLPITVNPTALTFIHDLSYNIPAGLAESEIAPIDITDYVFGGTLPYKYSIGYFKLDHWDSITNNMSIQNGIISGTRATKNTPAKVGYITVTDGAGASKTQYITIGGVAIDEGITRPVKVGTKSLTWKKPYLVNGGEPQATPDVVGEYNAYYDAFNETLYLNDYVDNTTDGIYISKGRDITIDLRGENKIKGPIKADGQYTNNALIIKGSGKLEIDVSHEAYAILGNSNIHIKGGEIIINHEYKKNLSNVKAVSIVANNGEVIFEGDSIVNIVVEGDNNFTQGISGYDVRFLGNSKVSVDVKNIQGDIIAVTAKRSDNAKVIINTTGHLQIKETGNSLNPKFIKYGNSDLYDVTEQNLNNGRKYRSVNFKNIPENKPYVQSMIFMERPINPLVYYNQPIDLRGFEIQTTDQYGNKTLIPLDRLATKGISTSINHHDIFPDGGVEYITFSVDDNGDAGAVSGSMEIKARYKEIPVSKIILNETSLVFDRTQTAKLTATVNPTNASHKQLLWSSNRPDVVTVDANGKLTPKAIGTATITVRAADGTVARCYVMVNN